MAGERIGILAAMSAVPAMQFRARRSAAVPPLAVGALMVGQALVQLGPFDAIPPALSWLWLAIGAGVLGFGMCRLRWPRVRVSFDRDGLVVHEAGFGRFSWRELEAVQWRDRGLWLSRVPAARRPLSRVQAAVARFAKAPDLAVPLGGLQVPAAQVGACIELAFRVATGPSATPTAANAARGSAT